MFRRIMATAVILILLLTGDSAPNYEMLDKLQQLKNRQHSNYKIN